MALFDTKYTSFENERAPTLRQYLKAKKGKSIPKKFMIVKIWVPGTYPSYTLETEHFRASVGKGTTLGKSLSENWSELIEMKTSVCLSVERDRDKVLSLSLSKGSNEGFWKDIGSDRLLGAEWMNS